MISLVSYQDFDVLLDIYLEETHFRQLLNDTDLAEVSNAFRDQFRARNEVFNFWKFIDVELNEIKGFGALYPGSLNPMRIGKVAEMSIYIRNKYQVKGYGIRLLRYITDYAQHLGLAIVQAIIATTNLPSIRAVENYDYQKVGDIPFFQIWDLDRD